MRQLLAQRGAHFTVDLPNQAVTGPDGTIYHFEIEPLEQNACFGGSDEIAHTQEYRDTISRFEETTEVVPVARP